ncbi:MAG: ImmA/IrrE family metallo-endopeptidase [Longimicrobiales bacterium]
MSEHGYRVRARSSRQIADMAEAFLRQIAPGHLQTGAALDLAGLVDHALPQAGIHVYPVDEEELPSSEAETRAGAGGAVEILMRQEFFEALFKRTSNTNRARSTLAHEVGHAVLHADEIRAGRHRPEEFALRRARRSEIKTYEDAEWQAHMFAGVLLIPRPPLRAADLSNVGLLAHRFDVSEAFVVSHLGRVRRIL